MIDCSMRVGRCQKTICDIHEPRHIYQTSSKVTGDARLCLPQLIDRVRVMDC